VKDVNLDTVQKATSMRVKRTPPKSYHGSSFQGARVGLTQTDDIIPALQAICTDTRTARATHNIYAYRIGSGQHMTEHYEDDGEYGAGRRLLAILKEKNISNQIICVSRWCGGKHLGPARFSHIEEAAYDIINAVTNI